MAGCSTRTAGAQSNLTRTLPRLMRVSRTRFESKPIRLRSRAGLIWAYLGPAPAPLVPNWEPFTWKNGFVQIVFADVPCNWLQCQENSIDPLHFEWMHMNWSVRLDDKLGAVLAPASEAGVRGIRLRLRLPAHPRGHERVRSDVDGRPRLPVAECAVHRRSLRVARPGGRRAHAERHVGLQPRAQGERSLRPGANSGVARPGRRIRRPAAGSRATS